MLSCPLRRRPMVATTRPDSVRHENSKPWTGLEASRDGHPPRPASSETLRRAGALMILVFLLGFAPLSPAQSDVIDRRQIQTLVDLGAESSEILAFLEKRQVTLTQADLTALEKGGCPKAVLEHLKPLVRPTPEGPATPEEVLSRWKKGKDEKKLLSWVQRHPVETPVGLGQILALGDAGVPKSVLKALRSPPKAPDAPLAARPPLTGDDIVLLAQTGVSTQEILDRIEREDAKFHLDPADLVRLKREGVPLPVLRAINERLVPKKETSPSPSPSKGHGAGSDEGQPASSTRKTQEVHPPLLITRSRAGYSLLRPRDFVENTRYQGARSLMQLVWSEPREGTLPEIEVSVLTVIAPSERRDQLVPTRLQVVAERFLSDLARSFKSEGIRFQHRNPEPTWLSGTPALRIPTDTTTGDGKGYVGAHFLLFSRGRIHVVSYNVSLEKSAAWRSVLERTVRSFSLDRSPVDATREESTPTDEVQVEEVFARWRDSVRHWDYVSWRRLHADLQDTVEARLTWLRAAATLSGQDRRVELQKVDPVLGTLSYKVFSLEGVRESTLRLKKLKGRWRLASD